MKFEVELTVSITGTVQVEAPDLEAARKAAQNIQGLTADVRGSMRLTGTDSDFTCDGMFADVEIDGVWAADEQEEAEDANEEPSA